jgi:hypothetical protein
MALLEFARDEMQRAGLYNADCDYGAGEIAVCVEKMVEAFSSFGHSGGSAAMTLAVFDKVIRFKPLTPLTSDPAEWFDVSESMGGESMWQNRRSPSVFSKDGGKTWSDLDAKLETT